MMEIVKQLFAGLSKSINGDLDPMQIEYYRGAIVGIIASYEDNGYKFENITSVVSANIPADALDNFDQCIPDGWHKAFGRPEPVKRTQGGTLSDIKPTAAHVEVTLATINFVKRRSSFSDLKSALRRHGWL